MGHRAGHSIQVHLLQWIDHGHIGEFMLAARQSLGGHVDGEIANAVHGAENMPCFLPGTAAQFDDRHRARHRFRDFIGVGPQKRSSARVRPYSGKYVIA